MPGVRRQYDTLRSQIIEGVLSGEKAEYGNGDVVQEIYLCIQDAFPCARFNHVALLYIYCLLCDSIDNWS